LELIAPTGTHPNYSTTMTMTMMMTMVSWLCFASFVTLLIVTLHPSLTKSLYTIFSAQLDPIGQEMGRFTHETAATPGNFCYLHRNATTNLFTSIRFGLGLIWCNPDTLGY
jgi:hypothetical protein